MASYENYSDQDLTLLLKDGNHAAFKELYNRYWDVLLDAAYKRLDDVEQAEELIQDLFISLFIRRENLGINTSLEAYLKTALKYKVLNAYRAKDIHRRYVASVVGEGIDEIETSAAEKEEAFTLKARELSTRLKNSMAKMPEKCKEVFILGKVQQQSNKAIAEKLGISVSTVEKHMSKALKIIREDHTDLHLPLLYFLLFFLK